MLKIGENAKKVGLIFVKIRYGIKVGFIVI